MAFAATVTFPVGQNWQLYTVSGSATTDITISGLDFTTYPQLEMIVGIKSASAGGGYPRLRPSGSDANCQSGLVRSTGTTLNTVDFWALANMIDAQECETWVKVSPSPSGYLFYKSECSTKTQAAGGYAEWFAGNRIVNTAVTSLVVHAPNAGDFAVGTYVKWRQFV
jgi:hypothetical protein